MQLKNFDSEHIKEETFIRIYQQILKGNIKDKQLIDLVYKYFHGNPDQLFKIYYQKEEPTKNLYRNKNCYSCGVKGHIKRDCIVQGLVEEEAIEFIFNKRPSCKNCKRKGHWKEDCPNLTKEKEFFESEEVSFDNIPCDTPYDSDSYEN
jgi:hypothetical protein